MLTDRNFLRGMLLIVISLAFGLKAMWLPLGRLDSVGPGFFPLVVSFIVFAIGATTVVRSNFEERVRAQFNVKNIGLIIASLGGFTLLSTYVNMSIGIVFMVFCSSFAVTSYSIARNVKIAVCLILVAFMFQRLLGLELHLY